VGARYSSDGDYKESLAQSGEDIERCAIQRELMNHGTFARADRALGVSGVTPPWK
jgi:hypothetical protein